MRKPPRAVSVERRLENACRGPTDDLGLDDLSVTSSTHVDEAGLRSSSSSSTRADQNVYCQKLVYGVSDVREEEDWTRIVVDILELCQTAQWLRTPGTSAICAGGTFF